MKQLTEIWRSYIRECGSNDTVSMNTKATWKCNALHSYVATVFSHDKVLAYQHPPSRNGDHSSKDCMWLPMWQGNFLFTILNTLHIAVLSSYGMHLSVYNCMYQVTPMYNCMYQVTPWDFSLGMLQEEEAPPLHSPHSLSPSLAFGAPHSPGWSQDGEWYECRSNYLQNSPQNPYALKKNLLYIRLSVGGGGGGGGVGKVGGKLCVSVWECMFLGVLEGG